LNGLEKMGILQKRGLKKSFAKKKHTISQMPFKFNVVFKKVGAVQIWGWLFIYFLINN
jgi:hypothetical protein